MVKTLAFALVLASSAFLLTGCEDGGHFIFSDPYEYLNEDIGPTRHSVFFESAPMQLALHEPLTGTLIGMYTDAAPMPDGRVIASVEFATGVNHASFKEVMRLGEGFPTMWMLECIAEQKIPVIVILPPEYGSPFAGDWEYLLTETAKAFAQFPVPMFAVFYPVQANSGWDTDTYIAFFRYARSIFARYAPHVAFVWSVGADVSNFMDFFPGNLATDWVGLSLFSSAADISYDLGLMVNFYHDFHQDFPIMLNIGVSHFSTVDHRYLIAETSAALKKIYQHILSDFPRVKMVNYMDINRQFYNGRDYRISADPSLRAAYQNSVIGFEQSLENFSDTFVIQPIRSLYAAIIDNNRIYLDARIIETELNLPVHNIQFKWLDGTRYVDAQLLGIDAVFYNGNVVIVPPPTTTSSS